MVIEKCTRKKVIMKYILSLLSLCLIALAGNAQPPSYDDLKILYADANYEKLVKVAEKYTDKDDTKKDPIPYYWMAKGLYKVSLLGTEDEAFKNAYKDAINYLGKALKYDSEGSINSEFEDFVYEFQMSLVERIKNDIAAGDSRKAYVWILKYNKASRNTVGALFMEGANKYASKDRAGARSAWKEAEEELEKLDGLDGFSPADRELLKVGILWTAESYISMRQEDMAKELLGKVAQWFEGDEEFKEKYDEIVN